MHACEYVAYAYAKPYALMYVHVYIYVCKNVYYTFLHIHILYECTYVDLCMYVNMYASKYLI